MGASALHAEAWCNAFSFVLRSTKCLSRVCAVSPFFRRVVCEPLSWDCSSVCICPEDRTLQNGRRHFEVFLPILGFCEWVFVNLQDGHIGKERVTAQRCFSLLAQSCSEIAGLCVRNWQTFERSGLSILRTSFPRLRHLEITGCDQISTYEAVIPVFTEHPTLLSLRTTFKPRAAASLAFSMAAPRTLMALGFVSCEGPDVLAALLERCPLEHFWFSAHGSRWPYMEASMSLGVNRLRTLSLPSDLSEEDCLAIARACPQLELLCRMRIGSSPFGSGALAEGFEVLPSGQGVVLRKRGSDANLAANGSLWAPYSHGDQEFESAPSARSVQVSSTPSRSNPSEIFPRAELAIAASRLPRGDAESIAELAAAAAVARSSRRYLMERGAVHHR